MNKEEMQFKFFGYKYSNRDECRTNEIKNLMQTLDNKNIKFLDLTKNYEIGKAYYKNNSKKFFNINFPNVNRQISYLPQKKASSIINIVQTREFSPNEMLKQIAQNKSDIDILSLPVEPIKKTHPMDGEIQKNLFLMDDEDYLLKTPTVFSKIDLVENVSTLQFATYIHEVAHGLLERHKNYTDDYLKAETISIFMEKLIIFIYADNNLIKLAQNNRWAHIDNLRKSPGAFKEQSNYYKYLKSNILAEHLFRIYIDGDENFKANMLNNISLLFNNNYKIEDLLEIYKVNIQNKETIEIARSTI